MDKVIIYQRVLPHYRVPFFDLLYEKLLESGISLRVVAGQEQNGAVPKTVFVDRPWVEYRKNIYLNFFGQELVVQRFKCRDLIGATGIVVEQANRLLLNYFLILLSPFYKFRLGLWGHGKNFQSDKPQGIKERFKSIVSKGYDFWFCYTDRGKEILAASGCCPHKIMVVRNSIDISEFEPVEDLRRRYSLQSSIHDNVTAIFCGGMYAEKNIPFLLNAIGIIKEKLPNFQMLFIGDGPDSHLVNDYASNNDWVKCVGYVSGPERIKYFSMSQIFLLPGLVGLAVLDSFAAQVPMLTTDIKYHSPEIDYLVDGVNGKITVNDAAVYAEEAIRILSEPGYLETLKEGCRVSAQEFSIDRMATNYSLGVLRMLGLD
ncbi:glycosyltransferase family 4 protein [Microbulbifer sp. CAU 1566]|uniref:glycosyltransferase family 4 protein n=1 Tax=Microbulbifer sp. CAU 1566 TaxID=2933269 RepID=UPI0020034D9E|nr:glycosyltransferase family 4 protein [Microbulbifer sp. CAU 1566]MCK7598405.1 glycosyltransferase family 4 protein [Microbulbifer sp. CAU 1566]